MARIHSIRALVFYCMGGVSKTGGGTQDEYREYLSPRSGRDSELEFEIWRRIIATDRDRFPYPAQIKSALMGAFFISFLLAYPFGL